MAKSVPKFLRQARSRAPTNVRSLGSPGSLAVAGVLGGPLTQAGVFVTPETALNYSAVFAAMYVISTDCAILPTNVYELTPGGGKVEIKDHPIAELYQVEPNEEVDAIHAVQVWIKDTLGFGVGYQQIIRDGSGYPTALFRLPPKDVTPDRDKAGRLIYKLTNGEILRPDNVLALKGFSNDGITGLSVVGRARQTIGLGESAEISAAGMFGQGINVSGFLKSSKSLSQPAQDNLREALLERYGGPFNAGKPGVLIGDYDWVPMGLNPTDGQFLATRAFNVIEICRWFNINPIKLMDYSNGRFSNIEQAQLDHVMTTLMPWLTFMEVEMNRKLLSKKDRQRLIVRHNVDARLRGDSGSRWSNHVKAFGIGTKTQNEIRISEDMNPIAGADRLMLPINNVGPTPGEDPVDPKGDPPTDAGKPAKSKEPDPIRDPLRVDAGERSAAAPTLDLVAMAIEAITHEKS